MPHLFLITIELIVLLFLSAFFSGSEAALFSLNKIKLSSLETEKLPSTKAIIFLRTNSKGLLITLLMCNLLVNTSATTIATELLFKSTQNIGLLKLFNANKKLAMGIIIATMTFLILFIGEIPPKAIALKYSERISRLVAYPLVLVMYLTLPIRMVIQVFSDIVIKSLGFSTISSGTNEITQEDVERIVIVESDFDKSEKEMISKLFKFTNTKASEIMCPRTEMICIDINTPINKIIEVVKDSTYSRIPVFDGTIDHIAGILYSKDLLRNIFKQCEGTTIENIIHPPMFVPESKKASALLKDFQEKRVHIAIIVDEYGGTAGLITLEDLLEELVGEIDDEFDEREILFKKLSDDMMEFKGKTPITVFSKTFDIDISSEDVTTMGGFLFTLFGKVPSEGEITQHDGVEFKIVSMEGSRILRFTAKRILHELVD